MKKIMKKIDYVTVVIAIILAGVVVSAYKIMAATAESNAITTEVALHQSKKESRLVQEMRLLTLEVRNLQKDIENVRNKLNKKCLTKKEK